MTKKATAADLLAALKALGAESIEELAALAADSTRADAAEKIETRLVNGAQTVEREFTNDDDEIETETITLAESWTDHLFELADSFAGDFSTETLDKPGRGSGKMNRTKVEIVTPRGTFLLKLDRDA